MSEVHPFGGLRLMMMSKASSSQTSLQKKIHQ